MVKLNEFNKKQTTAQLLEDGDIEQDTRSYLGMSGIGHPCSRLLWYQFRWCYKSTITRRIARLFSRGHKEENVVVADLRRIGYTVYGDQDEVACSWGHCKGHRDGVVEGVIEAPKTPHLFECKTMSDKYFKDMCKKGCEKSKPIYYAQCQIYMKHFKLKRALFIAVNKNDDSYYIERIRYDKHFADDVERKADSIVMAPVPPPRIGDKTWWECKFCDARYICHYDEAIERNCRTCTKLEPVEKGHWFCTRHEVKKDFIAQKEGCDNYGQIRT